MTIKPRRLTLVISTAVLLVGGMVAAVAGNSGAAASTIAASGPTVGNLDCNGFGAGPTTANPVNFSCTDIRRSSDERAEDNGHYVGHDEPLISYYSNQRGSGDNLQVRMKLPVEPPRPPTGNLADATSTFMLYPAFWFGMVLCDNESFPEGSKTCTPDSDSNIQVPFSPTHAGTAFLEMQFYPPGWSPFITQFSCDQKHWCASLHINSLQGDFNFNLNPNCEEPTAFAFIQRDGRPTGPAGPDNFTNASFTPNRQTMLMNGGDELQVTIRDTPNGILNQIDDLTTGQSGFMVASAHNGFRHIVWDPARTACNGAPYDYHPMYATSRAPQGIEPVTWAGWTAHTVNVSASLEIGHFESPDAASDPGGEETPCFPGPTIPGCIGTDQDFDGFSYQTAYPDGSRQRPSPLLWQSPRFRSNGDGGGDSATGGFGNTYTQVNFETDLPAIEASCDVFTGAGCTNPPPGATFYPFPHTMKSDTGCSWTIGANHPRQISSFGGNPTAAWGPLETTDFGGGFIASLNYASGPFRNPCP